MQVLAPSAEKNHETTRRLGEDRWRSFAVEPERRSAGVARDELNAASDPGAAMPAPLVRGNQKT
jgi:hypothetical protein